MSMGQEDRSLHEFGWSGPWVVTFKSRADVLAAFLPPPWHALDANGKNRQTPPVIDVQSQEMFPVLNAKRGKCLVQMPAKYVE